MPHPTRPGAEDAALEPLVKTIEVQCDQRMAFTVFIEQMGRWWPLEMFSVSRMSGATAKRLQVDARAGGRIVEVGPDDTEHHWGTIKAFNPYSFLSMDFHIVAPGYPQGDFSLVEVRCTPLGDASTRVELTQSNWKAFGEMAAMIRGGYTKGWSVIFEQRYKAACGG